MLAACFMGLSGVAPAIAQPAPPADTVPVNVAPREIVNRATKAIADIYFDAFKGNVFAADVRAAAAKGEFDALTDSRDMATALTNRLLQIDLHFNVGWSPSDPAAGPGGPSGPGPVMVRRASFGFQRVEALPGGIGYVDMRQFAEFQPDAPTSRRVRLSMRS